MQVILISQNRDFTDVVCELVRSELGFECTVMNDAQKAQAVEGAIVIAEKNAPVRMRQLLTDIQKAAQTSATDKEIKLGRNYGFYPRQRKLALRGSAKSVDLTDKEVQLLQSMMQDNSKPISKETLLKEVWNIEADLNTHTLETHIYRLRAKFKELSGLDVIEASDGGYRLAV